MKFCNLFAIKGAVDAVFYQNTTLIDTVMKMYKHNMEYFSWTWCIFHLSEE